MQAQQYLKANLPADLQAQIKEYLTLQAEGKNTESGVCLQDVYKYVNTEKLSGDIVNVGFMMFRVANGESAFEDSITVCIDEDFNFSDSKIFV